MEDNLQIIKEWWAKRGNLKQFYTDMKTRLEPLGYTAELHVDTITCYRLTEKKGFLGLRKQTLKEPVLSIRRQNGDLHFEEMDEPFIKMLANLASAD